MPGHFFWLNSRVDLSHEIITHSERFSDKAKYVSLIIANGGTPTAKSKLIHEDEWSKVTRWHTPSSRADSL
jgi:hypothetical protein